MSVLPDSFLGGSAPRLRTLQLIGIPFPALPNLLLSASDLVDLTLTRLPHSGYISPASMVACLSSLNRLKSLSLGFESPRSRPDQRSPPPQPRVVLRALTKLTFAGMADYSEDFLARIDAPVLDQLSMSFFTVHLNAFDVPRLKQFIGRAKGLEPFKAATVRFQSRSIRLELDRHHRSMLEVRCDNVNWQVDSMARVCSRLSPFLSPIERLDFIADYLYIELQRESAQILDLFRPFSAIRSLHVSRSVVPLIESALRGLIGPRATEVLPNLSDIFLGGPAIPGAVPEAMQLFVISRRLSRRPVAVHHWEGLTAYR
ncbi:hypothetical protein BC826DRAFT_1188584 [Russula brevipes]|nr:hypothetical protein BC826DRAFT_1188584 [Russula brevipes]